MIFDREDCSRGPSSGMIWCLTILELRVFICTLKEVVSRNRSLVLLIDPIFLCFV